MHAQENVLHATGNALQLLPTVVGNWILFPDGYTHQIWLRSVSNGLPCSWSHFSYFRSGTLAHCNTVKPLDGSRNPCALPKERLVRLWGFTHHNLMKIVSDGAISLIKKSIEKMKDTHLNNHLGILSTIVKNIVSTMRKMCFSLATFIFSILGGLFQQDFLLQVDFFSQY
jgi:hypothetical protein